jgi:thioredoxin 1
MTNIVQVNNENFEAEVLQSDVPVLVDFSATWCMPCQIQIPIMEEFAKAHSETYKVCKLDVDDAPQLASKFGIRSVPSLILFSHGQKLDMKVGLISRGQLDSFCQANSDKTE